MYTLIAKESVNLTTYHSLNIVSLALLLSAAVIVCGPPPTRVNCSIDSPMNGCGSVATYAPVDPETIHVIGDTTLTCGPSGMWEANISQSAPICVPSMP